MSADLEFRIARIIYEYDLVEPESTIIVAVSGGPDSMALLHVLAALRERLACKLVAAYVDHGLRPDETPAEIACVQQAAASVVIPSEIFVVNTKELALKEKLSLEHAARRLRYQALRACAAQYGAARIAVAHTADDQVEEVLLRLLRGSGRKGVAGMQLGSGDLIRPLLKISKKDILQYLGRNAVSFCHDSSNDDLYHLRNRVRHVLLPLLEKEFNPGIRSALLKTAENLSEDEAFLGEFVDDAFQRLVVCQDGNNRYPVYLLQRRGFLDLHSCLQRRLIERLLWQTGCPARYVHILDIQAAAAIGRNGGELHLSRGLRVGITRDGLEFSYPKGKRVWRGRLHTGKKICVNEVPDKENQCRVNDETT